MRRIVINGRFLSQPVTGVQRYAREVTRGLDRLLQSDLNILKNYRFEIAVPSCDLTGGVYSNIPVRTVGQRQGHLWEQIDLPRYVGTALVINLANTGPLSNDNQITTIHDASVFAAPSGYSTAFRLWYRFMHRRIGKRAVRIITDSEFSKFELMRYCKVGQERLTVIPLGAEHILDVAADDLILTKHGLTPGRFVLAAGSLNPNKNLAALRETAHRLERHGVSLVIAGGGNQQVFQDSSLEFPDSVKFLGYVSDSELRALYQNARCFVFPSRYEGFGLPPLEAMACGCPVVSSNAASLPEICGAAARMVSPDDLNAMAAAVMQLITDESLHADLVRKGREQASRFSWSQTVRKWSDLLDSLP